MKPDALGSGEQGVGNSHGDAAPSEGSGGWKTDGPVWRKCIEHLVEAARLNRDASGEQIEMAKPDIHALWRKRADLAESIVEAPAPTIGDAIVKAVVTAGLLAEGEVEVVVTPQYIEECDRALAVAGEAEQSVRTLEPELWNACQWVRNAMVEGTADLEACRESWWREFESAVRAIARYEAMTPVGLKAKGDIFQEVMQFASATEGLEALQMSYMRDFRSLAYYRMKGRHSPVPSPGDVLSP
jgi:hypothetical protein